MAMFGRSSVDVCPPEVRKSKISVLHPCDRLNIIKQCLVSKAQFICANAILNKAQITFLQGVLDKNIRLTLDGDRSVWLLRRSYISRLELGLRIQKCYTYG